MASVGKDDDRECESEVCLHFQGEKQCFTRAKVSPNSSPECSVCEQHPILDARLERQVPWDRAAGLDASEHGWEP